MHRNICDAFYVQLFTFLILNISLNKGATSLDGLTTITFIKITPLSFAANYSKNDYNHSKYASHPCSRQANCNNTADSESYPQIIPSAHFHSNHLLLLHLIYAMLKKINRYFE